MRNVTGLRAPRDALPWEYKAGQAAHGEPRARERPHPCLVVAVVLLAGRAAAAASLGLAATVRLAAANRIPAEDFGAVSTLSERGGGEGALDDPVAREELHAAYI